MRSRPIVLVASFAIDAHTVTPSVSGGNGTIAPSTAQSVNDGATANFTLTPNPGFHIDTVGGTCGGSLAGNVFTTAPVLVDCTVIASFAIDVHTVTPSATRQRHDHAFDTARRQRRRHGELHADARQRQPSRHGRRQLRRITRRQRLYDELIHRPIARSSRTSRPADRRPAAAAARSKCRRAPERPARPTTRR